MPGTKLYHRQHQQTELLKAVSKGLQPWIFVNASVVQFDNVFWCLFDDLVQGDHVVIDPLPEGTLLGGVHLELTIINNATFARVDQQHLARLQTTFLYDQLWLNEGSPNLGRADHDILGGDVEPARPQAVAI